MIMWQTVFAMLVLTNFIYAPFVAAFRHIKINYQDAVLSFEFLIECLWGTSILINFVQGSTENKIFTVADSAKRYMKGFGLYDIIAFSVNVYFIINPEAAITASNWSAFILFLRFLHFYAMFYPIAFYLKHYTVINRKRQSQILSVISTFTLMLFLAHILACYLVIVGTDEYMPLNDELWVANNQELWYDSSFYEDGGPLGGQEVPSITRESQQWKVYIFCYYWIWEVITTVGYGDRSVANN